MLDVKKILKILESPTLYKAWQYSFKNQKLVPALTRGDLQKAQRVLDLGCGPGINSDLFQNTHYTGIDINPKYISYAKKKFKGRFEVVDLRNSLIPTDRSFDFIFANSVFHHINDEDTLKILQNASMHLDKNGTIQILDLVLPEKFGLLYFIAKMDRGDYPRKIEHWKELLSKHFHVAEFKVYHLTFLGIQLWRMLYFVGTKKLTD